MIGILANSLVILGAGILVASLASIRQLIAQLPHGSLRRSWYVMTALNGTFIAGYGGYLGVFWSRHQGVVDLIVPVVFVLGACFVWLTSKLSLETAIGLRRVTLLEQETITDPLTGLYNRRYLDRRLEEECDRAQRYGFPMSILMIDIDHFKQVNDAHGHQVGDRVLSVLGDLILDSIRSSDVATRYGGDELVIMAPNTSAASAAILADRLRQHVASHPLALSPEPGRRQEIGITVSVGVAGFGPESNQPEALVHQADAALYRAKQEGRNRVVVGAESRSSSAGV